ncbi:hypothetical protein [Actinospica sp.]|uniref:hypothetical protein n=1 Tax=Actinospica sp. TaxID=1872142 RepID=UPI002C6C8087|nr:hypothetical protein [Actinospica sp.]HWG25077.1 hypothetical protein [Actinospica sp.]
MFGAAANFRNVKIPLPQGPLLTHRNRGGLSPISYIGHVINEYQISNLLRKLPDQKRTVPIAEETAEAIRALAAIRHEQHDRGLLDPDLRVRVRYPFLRNGTLAHADYVFAAPLRENSAMLGTSTAKARPRSTRTASATR